MEHSKEEYQDGEYADYDENGEYQNDTNINSTNNDSASSNNDDKMTDIVKNFAHTETDIFCDFFVNRDKYKDENNVIRFNKANVKPSAPKNESVVHSASSHRSNNSNRSNRSNRSTSSSRHKADSPQAYNEYANQNYKPPPQPSKPSHEYQTNVPEDVGMAYMKQQEERQLKMEWLSKLYELYKKGIPLTKNYNMNDSLESMKAEYNMHRSIKQKAKNIEYGQRAIQFLVWTVEMANKNYNPFEFNLDGWSDDVEEDEETYYDILSDLIDKYTDGTGTWPPEIRLIFALGMSGVMYHTNNTRLKNQLGDDELKQKYAKLKEKRESGKKKFVQEQTEKFKETMDISRKLDELKTQYESTQVPRTQVPRQVPVSQVSPTDKPIFTQQDMELYRLQQQMDNTNSDARSTRTVESINRRPQRMVPQYQQPRQPSAFNSTMPIHSQIHQQFGSNNPSSQYAPFASYTQKQMPQHIFNEASVSTGQAINQNKNTQLPTPPRQQSFLNIDKDIEKIIKDSINQNHNGDNQSNASFNDEILSQFSDFSKSSAQASNDSPVVYKSRGKKL